VRAAGLLPAGGNAVVQRLSAALTPVRPTTHVVIRQNAQHEATNVSVGRLPC
jgi:hypothetical protein